ncbi:MAG: GNAT family N-acetyltransferase [Actinomycetota bacterium]|nr:GNAT family N-acetyltransferase [Sporichthyaceae bacterium]MDQ3451079.1 GNAT family N-acetyltransferase [Actinomycetota bacterium]
MTRGWPVTLTAGEVGLRPLARRDGAAWQEVRGRNRQWLEPWEATSPFGAPGKLAYGKLLKRLGAGVRRGELMPFAVTYGGRLVGQLTVANILWGSACSATIGYWVDRAVAGRGVMPTAVALATDHCFGAVGLHRIEINIRPENTASLRVVEKLGFRDEGIRLRLLHINGAWADHRSYALTAGEVPDGLLARWQAAQAGAP